MSDASDGWRENAGNDIETSELRGKLRHQARQEFHDGRIRRHNGERAATFIVMRATGAAILVAIAAAMTTVANVRQRTELLREFFRRHHEFLAVERELGRLRAINAKINLPAPRIESGY